MDHVTIRDIASFLGDDGVQDQSIIETAKPIDVAGGNHLSLCRAGQKLDTKDILKNTQAGFIIMDRDVDVPDEFTIPFIRVDNARLAFMRVLEKFFTPKPSANIHPTAVIGDNVEIGEGTIIHPHVTLYDNVKIGKNCVIHSGCVIGADGFGFEKDDAGEIIKFPHIGGVDIHDNVEIMALTHIARGTLGDTVIGRNTKIDSLCHIAHNVVIGENAMVVACSLIGGSTVIKDGAYIAPCASVINKITIHENAFVGMASFVRKDVEANTTVIGSPARVLDKA